MCIIFQSGRDGRACCVGGVATMASFVGAVCGACQILMFCVLCCFVLQYVAFGRSISHVLSSVLPRFVMPLLSLWFTVIYAMGHI